MSTLPDVLRARLRSDALEYAAAAAWEHDHPATPWAEAPDSVRLAMRALVRPTVDAVLEHLDARSLLDLEPEPDTFPAGMPFDTVVTRALNLAQGCGRRVRFVHQGAPVTAYPGDTWQDVAGRAAATAEDAPR